MADKPFPAYEGDGAYFFVSYAHEDAALVYPEMAWIGEAGFNLWYDDGIHVGRVWRRALADALNKSVGMVFFCTEGAAESENCLQEINFALDEEARVRRPDGRDAVASGVAAIAEQPPGARSIRVR